MTQYEDPFSDPTPRSSAFASADSFRGRLILIEPTKIEHDIPKTASQPNGPRGDRITANVTVIDGKGPVEVYSNFSPTGKMLDGPLHRGVWFGQDQIVQALMSLDGKSLKPMVLCKLDTLRPGTRQGQGNPWTVQAATDAEKQMARDFLANRTVAQAAGDDESPF